MSIINIFPKICKLFPGVTGTFLRIGMVLVSYYHLAIENVVINTAFDEARGLEKFANTLLIPTHYLLEGKTVSFNGEEYVLKKRFQYQTGKKISSLISLIFFTPGTILGATLKGFSLFSGEVKNRHLALKAQVHSREVSPNLNLYQKLGIDISSWKNGEPITSQGYKRRPGDETNLAHDKEALKEISKLFREANIPFWADCGTCIGAYRYGGVIPWDNDLDLAILVNDFQNAKNILRNLDPKKFHAQDWSSRTRPGTYIRVYVKASQNHIDIYCNNIDPSLKTITYIVSHIDSNFMASDWKDRERTQIVPIPYDVVFPLKSASFDGIEIPIPNQTARFIQYKYGPNISPPRIYSEKTNSYEKDLTHPYWNVPLAH